MSDPISTFVSLFHHHHLQGPSPALSASFSNFADHLNASLPDNEQKKIALQKLLEAKDAAAKALAIVVPVEPTPVNPVPTAPVQPLPQETQTQEQAPAQPVDPATVPAETQEAPAPAAG